MYVQYGENQFFPVRDNGEIHPMDPVSGFDAGYIDDTFPDGSQPLGVPDPERYIAAGAIDRR